MSTQSIGIKIWGDLKDLTTALNKGSNDVGQFSTEAKKAFKNMTADVREGEQQIKMLALAFGKNSTEVKKATTELRPFQQQLKEAMTTATGGSNQFIEFGKSLLAAGAGFFAVSSVASNMVGFIKEGITEAGKEESANKRLLFALNNNTAAYERTLKFKEQLFKGTTVSKDEINQMIGFGLSVGRTEMETRKMTQAAIVLNKVSMGQVDLMTAMGALQGSYEGKLRGIIKYTGTLTEEQLRSGGAIDILLKKYGQYLQAGMETTEGKIKAAKKSWEELGEVIGTKFLPVIGEAARVMAKTLGGGNIDSDIARKRLDIEEQIVRTRDKWYSQKGEDPHLRDLKKELETLESIKRLEENKAALAAGLGSIATMRKNDVGSKYYPTTQATDDALIKSEEERIKLAKEAAQTLEEYKYQQLLIRLKAEHDQLIGPNLPTNMGEATHTGTIDKMTPKGAQLPISTDLGIKNPVDPHQAIKDMQALKDAISGVTSLLGGLGSNFQNMFASIGKLFETFSKDFTGGWKEISASIGETVSSAVSLVAGLFQQQTQTRLNQLDETYNTERERIEGSTANEKQKQKALAKLDKETSKQKKALLREQAQDDKTAAVFKAIIAGATGVVASLAYGGPLGIALAVIVGALAAAEIASIVSQPLPALAMGGLAYAPQMAIVGDNPGAFHDPEVIAPLSKLKQYMGGGESGGELSARVKGDDLLFILDRAKINQNRRY